MKVTSIIENTSKKQLHVEHGLSLHIAKSDGQKVLFDMGQSSLFSDNAKALSISISDIDIAVVSHGHYDHGGGLKTFIEENVKAKIFIHREAFMPHYSLRNIGLAYIGLDPSLQCSERLVFCDALTHVTDSMTLFADVQGNCCNPIANRLLFGPTKDTNDSFCHEQSLIIEEGNNVVLFAGCAHRGIINIIRKAEEVTGKTPTHVFAGMHLVKSGLSEEEECTFISTLATLLQSYKRTIFYTMHCTGEEQYLKLKSIMGTQIEYFACGDEITI